MAATTPVFPDGTEIDDTEFFNTIVDDTEIADTPVDADDTMRAAFGAQVDPVAPPPVVNLATMPGAFRMSFSPQEFVDTWETFQRESLRPQPRFKTAAQGFASTLVSTLVTDTFYKDKMDYNSLRMGTAPILKMLGIREGGLSDEQIIRVFAEDDEGRNIVADPTFFEGAERRSAGATGSSYGFFKGMQLGNAAASSIMPTSVGGAAVRLGAPLLAGVAGYIAGSMAGDQVTDRVLGKEPLIIRGRDSADYEAGKAAADALSFIVTPFTAPLGGASLGGRIALWNANKNFMGPIMEGASRTGVASLPARAVAKVEGITADMALSAATNPFKTLAVEGGAAGVGILGANLAETNLPNSPWVKFGFEAAGGVAGAWGADLAANRLPVVARYGASGIYNLFNRLRGIDNSPDIAKRYGMSETQLDAAGTFIVKQLEDNKENPDVILEMLNDSEFDKWLYDVEGNKINLDPATMSASVTLLSLQRQFMGENAASFGEDAGTRMRSSIDALRRGLLAMYANGSKSALSDAALVQISLFEAVEESKLARALSNFQNAMRKVRPEGDTVDLIAAEKIFEVLKRQYDLGREQERALWKNIPRELQITSFVNEEGVTQGVPNFISKWNELLADETAEAKELILKNKDLKLLSKFVDRKTNEMGLNADDGSAVAPVSFPEQRTLNTALDKIAGTKDADLPRNLVEGMQAEGADLAAILKELRRRASEARGDGDGAMNALGVTNKSATNKPLARALDAQANLLSAKKRQADEFVTNAAETSERVGLEAYEAYRTRGLAVEMAKRLSSEGKPYLAKIANQMGDALMADLNSMGAGLSQPYDTARSFSLAFNNVYTRAYAGDVLGTKPNGAPRIPVAQLAATMMVGDAAFMRTAHLDGIAQFQVTQSLTNLLSPDNPELAQSGGLGATLLADFKKNVDPQSGVLDMDLMRAWYGRNEEAIKSVDGLNTRITSAMNDGVQLRSAEDTLLRTVRANALNPDGSLNVSDLSNWRNKINNKRLLEVFPSIKADLENVNKASNLLTQTQGENAAAEAAERKAVGLYELLPDKTTNAATAVALAISSNNPKPFLDMNRLMRLVDDVGEGGFTVTAPNSPNKGRVWTPQDLKDGMRAAIYDTVLKVKADGKYFSPQAAYRSLFAKHPNADISIAEWMDANGLMEEGQLETTQRFLRKMAEVEVFTLRAKPGQTDAFYADLGEGIKLLSALGGARAGRGLQERIYGGSADLIASGKGSALGQKLTNKYLAELPQSLQADRIAIILENDVLLNAVLRKGRTPREKSALAAAVAEMFLVNYVVSPFRRIGGEALQAVTSEYTDDTEGQVLPPPASTPSAVPVAPSRVTPIAPRIPAPRQRSVPSARVTQQPGTTQAAPQRARDTPSGPVNRDTFAALFPEDQDLVAALQKREGLA